MNNANLMCVLSPGGTDLEADDQVEGAEPQPGNDWLQDGEGGEGGMQKGSKGDPYAGQFGQSIVDEDRQE